MRKQPSRQIAANTTGVNGTPWSNSSAHKMWSWFEAAGIWRMYASMTSCGPVLAGDLK